MRVVKLTLAAIAIAGSAIAVTPAWAACVPACTGGDICRYEAAGGKYYCAKPVTQPAGTTIQGDGKGVGSKQPGTPAPSSVTTPKPVERK